MGIPDTHTMPISHTNIFTVEESTCTQDQDRDQEQMGPCTQVFWRSLLPNKSPSISLNGDSSNIFSCEYIKKATNIKKFTRAEINKATNNYSKANIIGEGGSGKVYKGILPNNQLIAVKRPWRNEFPHCKNVYVNEIILLSQINHRSVVHLLGCCFESEVPSAIYEYIPNGSLYKHLFDVKNPCVLNWNLRLRIATQIAQVLAYLHHTIRVPIIHTDIKPSNILLDDNYMVKVCDFGISKLVTNQQECYSDVEDTWELDGIFTCLRGTIGYIAPEYCYYGMLTTKCDVYSFGVVLVELLTRKRINSFELEGEEREHLIPRFLKKLKDDHLVEILDEQLMNEVSMEKLHKVSNIAERCLKEEGKDRPSMRQVVRDLQYISGF